MHCNCYSLEWQNVRFWGNLPLWIKFVCFAHISIPTASFCRGMINKITWIWPTGIVIAKNDKNWHFWGTSSALNKICLFTHIPIPTFSFWLTKSFEFDALELLQPRTTKIDVFQEYLSLWIKFVCFAHIPIPTALLSGLWVLKVTQFDALQL